MKTIQFFLPVIILVMSGMTAFSQKYKTAADTIKLNEKYIETKAKDARDAENDVKDQNKKIAKLN